MDASSPLAAMHRPSAPAWGQSRKLMGSGNHCGGAFNIREQLQRSKPDYFNIKSIRGSSPTASLAADLSQNFRIDSEASPVFQTPRRALFTSNMLGHLDGQDYVATPPLPPSSSPLGLHDAMDISPAPAKDAFSTSIEITTPTPTESLDEHMMVESPLAMARQGSVSSLEPPKQFVDRRRIGLRRPSLSRNKVYSTSALITRLHPENQVSSFRFGGSASSMSPGECFGDSPPQERRPQTANSPSPSASLRPKPQFASLTGIRNGSPVTNHVRRPSNQPFRPRRQYRRSLSMFESPADITSAPFKADHVLPQTSLMSVMDVEEVESQEPILPHFFAEGQDDNIPRISRDTFLDLLDGNYSEHYTQKIVIDCRFEYEYDGGHIDGAINYNHGDLLKRHLFQTPMEGKTVLIFHCEFSANRAPNMARLIRAEDRTVNAEFYPKLTYPEIYVLEGGYREFFKQHRDRCYPQAYVEMDAQEHARTCERELGKLQQRRKGLNRAKTFAFGHRESMYDSSPTCPGRLVQHDSPSMMIGNSPILGNYRSPAMRMSSY